MRGKNAARRRDILKRNAQTVKHRMTRVKAFPSTKIAGGTFAPNYSYPVPLFKGAIPELGTEAAFPGVCFTASCYHSSLIHQADARLLCSPFSRTDFVQCELVR